MSDKELSKSEEDPIPISDFAMIQVIERAASNPEFDADKMDRLLAAQERILDRNATADFYAAMNRVQAKLPTVAKDAANSQTHSKYALHESIARAIKPIYTAEGFSVSFGEKKAERENYIHIAGVLRHMAGHSESYSLELPLDDRGIQGKVNKTALHASGSTFTYGRRYLTCLMFDVATGDDVDGNQPIEPITAVQVKEINAIIKELKLTPTRRKRFLQWGGVSRLSDLPATKYSDAIRFLEHIRTEAANADPAD